ncbi:hypothetical protein Cgig2_027623 [Carnegiea gigantea]|uniref:Uncharacterized protein n=1 Tax=Carnegiea gigantea TaxID=171969 RepID=A0A9Q1GZ11_9CARY|nr:hypothetical protein Cgig2_027623 [Carnegiea gigantea]
MCMFCVIQKWSRRLATMLPWLVIPLIGLWALSQLLPPAFRFEITSPRLACVFVLLITLFWYEVLMPQLSAWQVRRKARLRERKRLEVLELQQLRKTATKKCRNCLTPYRDQNPGGGKFMCSYCGHISKRPVLDSPIAADMGISNSGIIKDLFGKGGKILNGKAWSDNVSNCSQEWFDNGSWIVNGPFPPMSAYPHGKTGVGFFGGTEPCLGQKSCSGAYFFACKLLMSFLVSIRWLWRKLFRISSSREGSLSDAHHRGMLAKKDDNGCMGHESRGERARRKAEEKRLARLEKELMEEEERKQREEVARLVEERRRLRDEKIEAENRAKGTSSLREKESKKEAEKKRQERRKEKDKGSSKSNSDVEEVEKKAGKETEQKWGNERKSETDLRESLKRGLGSAKGHNAESGHGAKGNSTSNFNRGPVGTRYFDRMKGTFLSSSKAFTSGGFFAKVAPTPVPAAKDIKSNSTVDNPSVSNGRCDFDSGEHVPSKAIVNGDDKSHVHPVASDMGRKTAPRSWQQLFARSPATPASSHPNVISRPSTKFQADVQSSSPPCSTSSTPFYDNPINLPSLFKVPPFSTGPMVNTSSVPTVKSPVFPSATEMPHGLLLEDPELFEDPCYEPDPVSLLGPVSESLDNFQLDCSTGYISDDIGKSSCPINVFSPFEISNLSPIESPMSRLKIADEKQSHTSHLSCSPKVADMHPFPAADVDTVSDEGTWHMWNSSPLGPDGLSLVGDPTRWIAPLEQGRLNRDTIMQHSSQIALASFLAKENHDASGTFYQKGPIGNLHHHGAPGSTVASSNNEDPWLRKAFFPPLSVGESHRPSGPPEENPHNKISNGSPTKSAANHAFDPSAATCWSK